MKGTKRVDFVLVVLRRALYSFVRPNKTAGDALLYQECIQDRFSIIARLA